MDIILIMAITADGKIAKNQNHLTNWTSAEDKIFFKTETQKSGCLIMGRKTFATIGKPLPNRLNIIMTKEPHKFKAQPGLLEFTSDSPQKLLEKLKNRDFESIILCGGSQINTLFLQANLIDKIFLTIEPKIFGQGICLFEKTNKTQNLKLQSSTVLGENTVLLKYKVIK